MRSIICKGRRVLDREAMVALSAFARTNSVPIMAVSVLADMTINRSALLADVRNCDF